MPQLSVLMPVYDNLPWLHAALASLQRQTFRDFEVVAVDDGSSDGSPQVLLQAALRDPRIRPILMPHRGLPATLQTALEHSRAPLIARMDADDVSHRERFAQQVPWLAARRRIAAVGCRIRLFPAPAVTEGMRRWAAWHDSLLGHEEMAREALVDSPLAHGTAVLRRRWLERVGGWTEHGWPEDVDLWLRLLAAGARLAKLPRVLYGWRQHPGSATRTDPRYSRERYAELRLHHLRRGLLRGHRTVTLVGVGDTLAGWRERLAPHHEVRAVAAGRPGPAAGSGTWEPPIVLAFGTLPARERWRAALAATPLVELRDFVFVG